jgi:selenocysteine lyase/cysteine desulfurase
MVDWKRVRDDFPAAKKSAYFMSAGMTPLPKCVFERLVGELRAIHEGGDMNWVADLKRNRAMRGKIGGIINCDADDLAFTTNTSTSMSLVAMSLRDAYDGDLGVVSMMDEFPATTVPFEHLGIQMKYCAPRDARYPIDEILKLVDANTRAVVTSYVQYATGFRQDIRTLGRALRERGVLFVVNATQAFPYFPMDVKDMCIDAMSASLHKWGMTGQIGALFYTSPEFRRVFKAPMAGWLSIESGDGGFIHTKKNAPFKPKGTADRYVLGTTNLQMLNSFETAVDYMDEIGFGNIRERIFYLTDRLIEGLRGIDAKIISPVATREERSANVAFDIGGQESECVDFLEGKGIHVSYRDGKIRASVNIFNDESDIKKLVEAIRSFI